MAQLDKQMYGYIYETTNLVNGKKYIGQHRSEKLDSKYYGSNKVLRSDIRIYGKENFSIKIIKECYSQEEMDKYEVYYIKLFNAHKSSMYYNINCESGHCRIKNHSRKSLEKMSKSQREKWIKNPQLRIQHSKIISKSRIGMKHSKETKQKLREAKLGSKNPRYGKHYLKDEPAYIKLKSRHWYTNGVEEIFTQNCPEGFYAGRSKKFKERMTKNESVGNS